LRERLATVEETDMDEMPRGEKGERSSVNLSEKMRKRTGMEGGRGARKKRGVIVQK